MRSIFIVVAALASVPAVAIADDQVEAERLYNEGQAAFDANRFDEAVSAWERSYDLSKEPGLLFNLGQAYRQRRRPGDCEKARDAYKKFIELDAGSDQRPVAEGFASEMQKCVVRGVSTSIATPITAPPIDPSVAEPGNETTPSRTKKIAGLGIAGGGVVLLVTGFYFGHRASSLGDEVTRACNEGCDWAVYGPKDADGRSAQTKQYIFDGIGVAAIVGGGVLYWLGSREQAPSPIAITPRGDGVGISWTGSW